MSGSRYTRTISIHADHYFVITYVLTIIHPLDVYISKQQPPQLPCYTKCDMVTMTMSVTW